MNILTLDFETHYSDTYTLQRGKYQHTTEEYVRSPLFEPLVMGLCINSDPIGWFGQEDIPAALAAQDWDNTAVLCHHAHFDGLILSHHYGVKPRAWLDTLSMARLQLGNHVSVSLANLAAHYGLAGKNVPYDAFRGKRWADLDAGTRSLLGAGCLHDVELTFDIFQRLAVNFPASEYQVIDHTIRAFTEPQLIGDIEKLGEVWVYEDQRKKALLEQLAVTPGDLQSADKFVELLEREGIEVETKAGKIKPIPAIASTDDFLRSLKESENERVRFLVEARLSVKSNGAQTRSERLGWMASRGPMPVYLNYCGAHTTRWSGGDAVNWQNFGRGSPIRKAMSGPPGFKVVKADKSQIECRILNFLAEQWDVIERFANNEDPYTGIASKFYGREITKANPAERGVGKQLELSCGYGAGGDTIVRTAKRGTYGPPVMLSADEGVTARDLYRSTHPGVVNYWKTASRMIAALAGTSQALQWGPMTVDTGVIWGPGGVPIWYPELHHDGENWQYKTRKGFTKLYGGKLTENVIQFLSRLDMSASLSRIFARTRIRWVHLEHDAATWLVPLDLVAPFVKIVEEEMTRAPDWLPGIPLGAEISTGETM